MILELSLQQEVIGWASSNLLNLHHMSFPKTSNLTFKWKKFLFVCLSLLVIVEDMTKRSVISFFLKLNFLTFNL